MSYLTFDIETTGQSRALAIPSDAEERQGKRTPWDKTCALNPRLGRIVSVGFGTVDATDVWTFTEEGCERKLVEYAVRRIGDVLLGHDTLVTFAGQHFDLPFLHVRAAILGVPLPYQPSLVLKRYVAHPHADLLAVLMNWDRPEKGDNLHGWCEAFGIEVTDDTSGADIGAMVEQGDVDGIRAHCASDLQLTASLAERMASANLISL